MDTYYEIAQEIAQNLNWPEKVEAKLNQILQGILYAEQKILGGSQGLKVFDRIVLKKEQSVYSLPDEFDSAYKVIITNREFERFSTKEIEVGQLMAYETEGTKIEADSDLNVNPDLLKTSTDDIAKTAMYRDYILYAFQPDRKGFKIIVKPAIDGYLYLYYSATCKLAERKDLLERYPDMPKRFWFGIVAGATYYLLRREITAEKDPNIAAVKIKSSTEFKNEFFAIISEFVEMQQNRSEPPIAKPF